MFRAAKLRVCADGGANRLYDEMPQFFPQQDALDIRHRFVLVPVNIDCTFRCFFDNLFIVFEYFDPMLLVHSMLT